MYNLSAIQKILENRKSGILGSTSMNSAVIVPLIYIDNELSVLFEVRSKQLNKQPGEICFPGGRIDSTDPSAEAAALRELTEEIGIPKQDMTIMAPLDVLVTPFRGVIYPFLAELRSLEELNINQKEVDHIFTVPLSYLHQHKPAVHTMKIHFEPGEGFPLNQVPNKQAYTKRYEEIPEYFYYYQDYVIWGLTARILAHFLDLLKRI
ncbi:CoA pyrophosphatase [Alkalihalobacillus sp. MEB130]|uniref:NUDIX hydrolase n=1 Tax=Alkalihalobacillus sp. MEB130 TaxID=2976704 RepID=UPI0028DD8E3A|nr:CoA pyrophosphatase [Alkalihalobacillus sp. MEB130]MDT8861495.1 CoA pyrophosphatase [Alkalihalobacillus sp. MEB130]